MMMSACLLLVLEILGVLGVHSQCGSFAMFFGRQFHRHQRGSQGIDGDAILPATLVGVLGGFEPIDRILRISDRFIDFVVYETVKECFYRIDSSERESDGFLRKLINGDLGSR